MRTPPANLKEFIVLTHAAGTWADSPAHALTVASLDEFIDPSVMMDAWYIDAMQETQEVEPSASQPRWWCTEDWFAVWFGGLILAISLVAVLTTMPAEPEGDVTSPLSQFLIKPTKWSTNPLTSVAATDHRAGWTGVGFVFVFSLTVFATGVKLSGRALRGFTPAFAFVFVLACVALVIAAQKDVKSWNLEYALWALGIGLLISNTIGTPEWVRPGLNTEFYIKTGLVLYGARVLFGRLLSLGAPGLCVAWIVTPVVLVTTYWFGQRVLRMPSKTLNMVISADMSVCGVSAAIATAAACRAKKEELSLAIGISLTFTVIMMVVMPAVVTATGMHPVIGGAWIGGTIDSTGAVGAAGEMVSERAGEAAITIKLIQNILIGVTAFCVALYWVRFVDSDGEGRQPELIEVWRRFPKFVIGFLLASAIFSAIDGWLPRGDEVVKAVLNGGPDLKQGTDALRGWFFALAFVSIGLESDFRSLEKYLRGGKPLLLYLCGQSLNLVLTFIMAWLMFSKLFPGSLD